MEPIKRTAWSVLLFTRPRRATFHTTSICKSPGPAEAFLTHTPTANATSMPTWTVTPSPTPTGVLTGPVITKYYYFGGLRVAMKVGDTTYYFHADHLGSTRVTTDESGAVVNAQTYLAFGAVRTSEGTSLTDFSFTGQKADSGTGLLYYGARYYDRYTNLPETGYKQPIYPLTAIRCLMKSHFGSRLYSFRWSICILCFLVSSELLVLILCGCSSLSQALISMPQPPRRIISSTLPLDLNWVASQQERFRYLPITYHNDVFIRTESRLVIYKGSTGQELWSYDTGVFPDAVPEVVAAGDAFGFSSSSDKILNLGSLQEMKVLWSQGSGFFDQPSMWSLALDRDAVYATWFRPSHVTKYDLKNGKELWRQGRANWGVTNGLVIQGDNLYVLDGTALHILDRDSGAIIEDRELMAVSFQLQGNTIYQSSSSQVIAQDVDSGAILWTSPYEPGKCAEIQQVTNGTIYAGVDCNGLEALDAKSGRMLWQTQFGAQVRAPVVFLGKTGYAILSNGSIVGFDPTTGKEVGRLVTSPASVMPYWPDSGLAVDRNMLFATFADHQLFAFEGQQQ